MQVIKRLFSTKGPLITEIAAVYETVPVSGCRFTGGAGSEKAILFPNHNLVIYEHNGLRHLKYSSTIIKSDNILMNLYKNNIVKHQYYDDKTSITISLLREEFVPSKIPENLKDATDKRNHLVKEMNVIQKKIRSLDADIDDYSRLRLVGLIYPFNENTEKK